MEIPLIDQPPFSVPDPPIHIDTSSSIPFTNLSKISSIEIPEYDDVDTVSDSEEEEPQDLLIKPAKLANALKKSSMSKSHLLNIKSTKVLPIALEKVLQKVRQNNELYQVIQFQRDFQAMKQSRRTKDAYQRHPYIGELIEHTLICSRKDACELLELHERILVDKFDEGKNAFQSFLLQLKANIRVGENNKKSQRGKDSIEKQNEIEYNRKPTIDIEDHFLDIPLPEDDFDEDQDYDFEKNQISEDFVDEEELLTHATQRRSKHLIITDDDDDDESQTQKTEQDTLESDDQSQEAFKFRGEVLKKSNIAKRSGLPQSFFTKLKQNTSSLTNQKSWKRPIREEGTLGVARKKKKTFTIPKVSMDDYQFITDEIIPGDYDEGLERFNFDDDDDARMDEQFFDAISRKYEVEEDEDEVEEVDEVDDYVGQYDGNDDYEESFTGTDNFKRDFLVTESSPIQIFLEDKEEYQEEYEKFQKSHRKQFKIDDYFENTEAIIGPNDYDFDNREDYLNIYSEDNINFINRQGEAQEVVDKVDYLLMSTSPSAKKSLPGKARGFRSRGLTGGQKKRSQGVGFRSSASSSKIPRAKQSPTIIKERKKKNQPQILKMYLSESDEGESFVHTLPYQTNAKSITQSVPKPAKKSTNLNYLSSDRRLLLQNHDPQCLIVEEPSNEFVLVPVKSKPNPSVDSKQQQQKPIDMKTGQCVFKESHIYHYLVLNKPIPQRFEYFLINPSEDTHSIFFSIRSLNFTENFEKFSESLLIYPNISHLRTHRINFAMFQEFLTTVTIPDHILAIGSKLKDLIRRLESGKEIKLYAWYLSQIMICFKIIGKTTNSSNGKEQEYVKRILRMIFSHLLCQKRDHYMIKDTLEVCFSLEHEQAWPIIYGLNRVSNIPMLVSIWQKYHTEINWEFVIKVIKEVDAKYLLLCFRWISSLAIRFDEHVILCMAEKLASFKFMVGCSPDSRYLTILTLTGGKLKPVSTVNIYINCFLCSTITSPRIKERIIPTAMLPSEEKRVVVDRINILLAAALKFGYDQDIRINDLLNLHKLSLCKSLEIFISMIQINENQNHRKTNLKTLDKIVARLSRFHRYKTWSEFLGFLNFDTLNMCTFDQIIQAIIKHFADSTLISISKDLFIKYIDRSDNIQKIETFRLNTHPKLLEIDLDIWIQLSDRFIKVNLTTWELLLQSIQYDTKISELQRLMILEKVSRDKQAMMNGKMALLTTIFKNLIFYNQELSLTLSAFVKTIFKGLKLTTTATMSAINSTNRWTVVLDLLPHLASLEPRYCSQLLSMLISSMNFWVKSDKGIQEAASVSRIVREIGKYEQFKFIRSLSAFEELTNQTHTMDDPMLDDHQTVLVLEIMKTIQSVIGKSKTQRSLIFETFIQSTSPIKILESIKTLLQILLSLLMNHLESTKVYIQELITLFSIIINTTIIQDIYSALHILKLSRFILTSSDVSHRYDVLLLIYPILRTIYYQTRGIKEYHVFEHITKDYRDEVKILEKFELSLSRVGSCNDLKLIDGVEMILDSQRVALGGRALENESDWEIKKKKEFVTEMCLEFRRLVER